MKLLIGKKKDKKEDKGITKKAKERKEGLSLKKPEKTIKKRKQIKKGREEGKEKKKGFLNIFKKKEKREKPKPLTVSYPPSNWVEIERHVVDPPAEVAIYLDPETQEKKYFVLEPKMTPQEEEVCELLADILKKEIKPPEEVEDKKKYIYSETERLMKKYKLHKRKTVRKEIVQYYIFRDLVSFGPLHAIMKDDQIEDISCNGVGIPIFVWHRRHESMETNITFTGEKYLDDYTMKLVHMAGKHVSTARPVVDGMLEGKHRVAVGYKKEVTMKGSAFTIRKFREVPFTITDLLELGTLDEWIAAYVWLALDNRMPLFVVGATAAGKTTLLNCLATLIKPSFKIVTVEETPEINLFHKNWLQFAVREKYGVSEESVGEVSLFDLVKATLRHRPDFLIVGEVRGEEASVMVQAIATGHSGLTTFHAEDVDSAVKRLTQRPLNIAPAYIPLLKVFLMLRRVTLPGTDKTVRRIVEVHEVLGYEGDKLQTFIVSKWDPVTDTFKHSFEKSYNLRKISEETGVPFAAVLKELENRASFLLMLKKKGVKTFAGLEEELTKYYAGKIKIEVEEIKGIETIEPQPTETKEKLVKDLVTPIKKEVSRKIPEIVFSKPKETFFDEITIPKIQYPLREVEEGTKEKISGGPEQRGRVTPPSSIETEPKVKLEMETVQKPEGKLEIKESEEHLIRKKILDILVLNRGKVTVEELVKRCGEKNIFYVLDKMKDEGLVSTDVAIVSGTPIFYYILTLKGRKAAFE